MTTKKMISLAVIVFALVAAFFFNQNNPAHLASQTAAITETIHIDPLVAIEYGMPIKVAHVVDGDTIQLINGDYLRYIGIDTPEEFDPKKPVQCFATQAAQRNKELVEGKEIVFYNDVSKKDRYGRWLGFVYLPDGTLVNKELIKEGYAFAYPYKPDISMADEFEAAETEAKNDSMGLWANCNVTILKSGREQTNSIK